MSACLCLWQKYSYPTGSDVFTVSITFKSGTLLDATTVVQVFHTRRKPIAADHTQHHSLSTWRLKISRREKVLTFLY